MAVYTPLRQDQVAEFIDGFGFVRLRKLKATDSGIENTNYFVTADDRDGKTHNLVLTLFEQMPLSELPYFVELTSFLAKEGLPVPAPYRSRQGEAILHLEGKPAIIVPCFDGQHCATPSPAQCRGIADAMVRMHLASARFDQHRQNDRGAIWREESVHILHPFLSPEQRNLLEQQVTDWRDHQAQIEELPAGINHHDLFHDNALFKGDQLTGIIDFYNACDDSFIYDLAVLVNDWCSNQNGELDPDRYDAVMDTYQQQRPFTPQEQTLWPRMLRYAALRFWISRLLSWHSPSPQTVTQKDPEPMRKMLLLRIG